MKNNKPDFTQYMAFGVGCSQLIGCVDGDALSALVGFAIGIVLYSRYYDTAERKSEPVGNQHKS